MTKPDDQIPENAEMGKYDPNTGTRWVYVTPEMARAHPKYRLNGFLWGIVAVIFLSACVKIGMSLEAGSPIWLSGLVGLPGLVIAGLLAMKSPWTMVVTVVLLVGSILNTVRTMQAEATRYNGLETVVYPLEIGLLIFMLVYLLESDRANLIYRHRYRKYSDLTGRG